MWWSRHSMWAIRLAGHSINSRELIRISSDVYLLNRLLSIHLLNIFMYCYICGSRGALLSHSYIYGGCLFRRRNNDVGSMPGAVNFAEREKWRECLVLSTSSLHPPSFPVSSLSLFLLRLLLFLSLFYYSFSYSPVPSRSRLSHPHGLIRPMDFSTRPVNIKSNDKS